MKTLVAPFDKDLNNLLFNSYKPITKKLDDENSVCPERIISNLHSAKNTPIKDNVQFNRHTQKILVNQENIDDIKLEDGKAVKIIEDLINMENMNIYLDTRFFPKIRNKEKPKIKLNPKFIDSFELNKIIFTKMSNSEVIGVAFGFQNYCKKLLEVIDENKDFNIKRSCKKQPLVACLIRNSLENFSKLFESLNIKDLTEYIEINPQKKQEMEKELIKMTSKASDEILKNLNKLKTREASCLSKWIKKINRCITKLGPLVSAVCICICIAIGSSVYAPITGPFIVAIIGIFSLSMIIKSQKNNTMNVLNNNFDFINEMINDLKNGFEHEEAINDFNTKFNLKHEIKTNFTSNNNFVDDNLDSGIDIESEASPCSLTNENQFFDLPNCNSDLNRNSEVQVTHL